MFCCVYITQNIIVVLYFIYWRIVMIDESNTFERLKSSPCALPFFHPDYIPPTPEEVAMLIKISGLSQRQAALVTGVSSNSKGSPTIRRWKTDIHSSEHRSIPYAAWRLLLEFTGISTTEQVRAMLKKQ